jgi:hypothetical protein
VRRVTLAGLVPGLNKIVVSHGAVEPEQTGIPSSSLSRPERPRCACVRICLQQSTNTPSAVWFLFLFFVLTPAYFINVLIRVSNVLQSKGDDLLRARW